MNENVPNKEHSTPKNVLHFKKVYKDIVKELIVIRKYISNLNGNLG